MRTGKPFVHLKLAATLDGRIAASGGDSRWVTGKDARRRAHELRAEAGAVLVGANTVRTDDPMLTARDLPVPSPRITRVVLDPHLTISPESKLAEERRRESGRRLRLRDRARRPPNNAGEARRRGGCDPAFEGMASTSSMSG